MGKLPSMKKSISSFHRRMATPGYTYIGRGRSSMFRGVRHPPLQLMSTNPAEHPMGRSFLDFTAQSSQANGGDWKEETYLKIKSLKELYWPELNEMYQKIARKVQQHDSFPQQPKSEQLEKLKMFKAMVGRLTNFLQLPKSEILPTVKEKLPLYEKQIVNFLNTNRPRGQQGQLPPHHVMQPQPQQ